MVAFHAAGTFERITAPCLLTFEREMTVWVLAFQVIFWKEKGWRGVEVFGGHAVERPVEGDVRDWKTLRRLLGTHCLATMRLPLEDGRNLG